MGACSHPDMGVTYLVLCHTGVAEEGVEMFSKCSLKTGLQDWRRWEAQLFSGTGLGGTTEGCIQDGNSNKEGGNVSLL